LYYDWSKKTKTKEFLPIKHPKPLNRLTMPVALLNFFKPTMSTKYMVVKEFIPAFKNRRRDYNI